MLSKVPVSQLRVFEAAGRRNSLQAAAAELHLTPSAVSHAIRKMEQTPDPVESWRRGSVLLEPLQARPQVRGTGHHRRSVSICLHVGAQCRSTQSDLRHA
jgi:hypothetical protein